MITTLQAYDNIYIDGKPLYSMVDKNGITPEQYYYQCFNTLMNNVMEGKIVEVAKNYSSDGKLKTEIVPIEFKVSEKRRNQIKEEYVERHHNWFRRTFLDWGPFKIKRKDPLKMATDSLKINKENRHQQILEDRNTRILDIYNKNNPENTLAPGEVIEEFEVVDGTYVFDELTNDFVNKGFVDEKGLGINERNNLDMNVHSDQTMDDEKDLKHSTKAHKNEKPIIDDFETEEEKNDFLNKQKDKAEEKINKEIQRLFDFLDDKVPEGLSKLSNDEMVEKLRYAYINLNEKDRSILQEKWVKNHPEKNEMKILIKIKIMLIFI